MRKRASGTRARHRLVFVNRVSVTLVHLRHGLSHAALGLLVEVDRSTFPVSSSDSAFCRSSAGARFLAVRGCACASWKMCSLMPRPRVWSRGRAYRGPGAQALCGSERSAGVRLGKKSRATGRSPPWPVIAGVRCGQMRCAQNRCTYSRWSRPAGTASDTSTDASLGARRITTALRSRLLNLKRGIRSRPSITVDSRLWVGRVLASCCRRMRWTLLI